MKPTIEERFWSKVEKTNSCWNWKACIVQGYGQIGINGKNIRAHRWSYVQAKGEIPSHLVLDHICRNTKCVNPNHLRAVTVRENSLCGRGPCAINAKKKKCKRGHNLSGDNLVSPRDGTRECKKCRKMLNEKYRDRNRAVAGLGPIVPRNKLTPISVRKIRRLIKYAKQKNMTFSDIARMFGVVRATISDIKAGRRWGKLK